MYHKNYYNLYCVVHHGIHYNETKDDFTKRKLEAFVNDRQKLDDDESIWADFMDITEDMGLEKMLMKSFCNSISYGGLNNYEEFFYNVRIGMEKLCAYIENEIEVEIAEDIYEPRNNFRFGDVWVSDRVKKTLPMATFVDSNKFNH